MPNEQAFVLHRRDLMLGFSKYVDQLTDIAETFDLVTDAALAGRVGAPDCSAADLSASSSIRAGDAVRLLHLQYSAGAMPPLLQQFLPTTLHYWEVYAGYHEAFHRTPESPYVVAHLTLQDDGYWDAIRLVSFAILLGCTDTLRRLAAIWDYGDNPWTDCLSISLPPTLPVARRLPTPAPNTFPTSSC